MNTITENQGNKAWKWSNMFWGEQPTKQNSERTTNTVHVSTLANLMWRMSVFYSVEMLFASPPQESTLVLNTTQND